MRPFLRDHWLTLTVATIVTALLGGCLWDFAAGNYNAREAVLSARRHVPAWTEVKTEWVSAKDTNNDGVTDRPGYLRTYTVHHPDQWYLYTVDGVTLPVSGAEYHRTHDGQRVIIRQRVGRFTGIGYPWALTNLKPAVEQ